MLVMSPSFPCSRFIGFVIKKLQAKGRSQCVCPIEATELGPNWDRDPFKSARRAPPACGETVVLSTCLGLEFQLQSRLDVAAAGAHKLGNRRADVHKRSSLPACRLVVPFPA